MEQLGLNHANKVNLAKALFELGVADMAIRDLVRELAGQDLAAIAVVVQGRIELAAKLVDQVARS